MSAPENSAPENSAPVTPAPATPAPVTVRHRGWTEAPRLAPLPVTSERGRGLTVTDRAVLCDGVPVVPVSGELHYSRVPRARWGERLRRMRAGGITIVSTYVLWIHHEPERGAPSFEGDLDVAAFIDEAAAAGLDVALRIGPWAHGEARNGGFPDWVQDAAVVHRSDDPAYLDLVRTWFGHLAAALDGRATPGGPIVAIQVENELYDRPEHLATLQRMAREAGMAAPLWTATAWGGAQLPADTVFPLYGGYSDGFWADPADGWHPSFRAHFFFSEVWDDPGVGADVRAAQGFEAATADAARPGIVFPPATCELGGGMATAYHRRPVPTGRDVATVAHIKVGNGSAWQGYYMYAGGRNPGPGLHESIDTGYPNDITPLGYDFHAPLGQSGDAGDGYALLREQHAFLAAFGDRLGAMRSSLPERRPEGLDDDATLRWALRSDGASGFVFVSRHQPHRPLPDAPATSLRVELDAETVEFAPVPIPAGTLARWPVGLEVGGVRMRWATASALTLLAGSVPAGSVPAGSVPTLVLVANAGVPALVAIEGESELREVEPGRGATRIETGGGALDLLVLPADSDVWVRERTGDAAWGGRELLLSGDDLLWDDASLSVRSPLDDPRVERYDPDARSWRLVEVSSREVPAQAAPIDPEPQRAAAEAPADYGFGGPRHRAPSAAEIDRIAAVWRLDLPEWAVDARHDAVLDIAWAGDVAELRVDGTSVDDRYFDGERWRVSVGDAGIGAGSVVTLHIVPLSASSTVWLPAGAEARRSDAAPEQLLAVDGVTVTSRGPWRSAS